MCSRMYCEHNERLRGEWARGVGYSEPGWSRRHPQPFAWRGRDAGGESGGRGESIDVQQPCQARGREGTRTHLAIDQADDAVHPKMVGDDRVLCERGSDRGGVCEPGGFDKDLRHERSGLEIRQRVVGRVVGGGHARQLTMSKSFFRSLSCVSAFIKSPRTVQQAQPLSREITSSATFRFSLTNCSSMLMAPNSFSITANESECTQ